MASALGLTGGHDELIRVIRRVRNRWRMRVALRGGAIVLGAWLLTVALSAYGMEQFRFSDSAVLAFRVGAYAALLALIVRFLAMPLSRRIPDERVALYIEEHEPSLEAAVLSAVEQASLTGDRPDRSPALIRRLIESAVEKTRAIRSGSGVEERSLRFASGTLGATIIAAAAIIAFGPAFLRQGARLLLMPWGTAEAATTLSIAVVPGNATLARGGDQRIVARLHGFDAERAEIFVKRGDGTWEREPMSADKKAGEYVFRMFDVKDRSEYYVEASGVRSPLFRLDVVDLPFVHEMDLEYRFPAYTGKAPEKVEKGGDVVALRGTTVMLHAKPTMPVRGGRILVEGQDPSPLTVNADGTLSGSFKVDKEGFYKLELEAENAQMVSGSLDYTIDVLADLPPTVSFTKPGRDSKVTTLEEVFTEVKAADDFGVRKLELVYSINGGAEQTIVLNDATKRTVKELTAGHTFFLEELKLQPGDVISYFARATDTDAVGGPKTTSTDIYFMNVRPFSKTYREAEQGGGGGGGEQDSPDGFSQRQRDIVAGTFKTQRDKSGMTESAFRENIATLALSQGRLRERVERLASRMAERGVLAADSSYAKIIELLPKAAAEMKTAEEALGTRNAKEAMPAEQRALQHLQQAEAAYREIQISRGGGGGGGGGGQQSDAENLADLFELQTDKMRNQYEAVENGAQQAQQRAVDSTLDRLKQLAQRQIQENERAREKANALQNQQKGGGGGGGGQRQLAQETEDLARKLERLAREQQSPELGESARRLQDAANAMKQSGAGGSQGSTAAGEAALKRLEDARRLLDDTKSSRLQREAESAVQRANQLAEKQREIASEVSRMGAGGGDRSAEGQSRLMAQKDSLAAGVAGLEAKLDSLASDTRRERKDASRKLREAANSIRENQLTDKIRYSKNMVRGASPEYANNFEGQISANIDDVRKKTEGAAGAVGEQGERKAAGTLDKARELVRGLESMDERIRQRAEAGKAGEQQGASAQGQQGQQGKGQQGQGQQGQAQPGQGRQEKSGQQGQGQKGEGQQGQQGQGQQGQGQQGQGQQGQQGQGQPGNGEGNQGGRLGGGPPTGGAVGRASSGFTPEDARQFGRELRERRQSAEALRQELARQGRATGDLDKVIDQMRKLEGQGVNGDAKGLAQLQASIIDGMKLFEFNLRKQIEGPSADKPLLGGSDEVPAGYKQLVEEYYRALSKRVP